MCKLALLVCFLRAADGVSRLTCKEFGVFL